ncbi:MAG: rnhA operon protein [Halobacteriaceae archaeon]
MTTDDTDLPDETVAAVERLTRLARRAVDEQEIAAYREERADLLAEYDYDCRVREEGQSVTLVCHPAEWLDDEGVVRFDAVEDTNRAVEVPLAGPGDPDEWSDVAEHNREIAREVREKHGDVHGDTAEAFAAFMSNHYARPVETAAEREIETFTEDYFRRNAWPSEEQEQSLEESLEILFEVAGRETPTR